MPVLPSTSLCWPMLSIQYFFTEVAVYQSHFFLWYVVGFVIFVTSSNLLVTTLQLLQRPVLTCILSNIKGVHHSFLGMVWQIIQTGLQNWVGAIFRNKWKINTLVWLVEQTNYRTNSCQIKLLSILCSNGASGEP